MLAGPLRFFPFLRASVPPCENPFCPQQAACPVAVRLSLFLTQRHGGTKVRNATHKNFRVREALMHLVTLQITAIRADFQGSQAAA